MQEVFLDVWGELGTRVRFDLDAGHEPSGGIRSSSFSPALDSHHSPRQRLSGRRRGHVSCGRPALSSLSSTRLTERPLVSQSVHSTHRASTRLTERPLVSQSVHSTHRASTRLTERPLDSQSVHSSHRASTRLTERPLDSQSVHSTHRASTRLTERPLVSQSVHSIQQVSDPSLVRLVSQHHTDASHSVPERPHIRSGFSSSHSLFQDRRSSRSWNLLDSTCESKSEGK